MSQSTGLKLNSNVSGRSNFSVEDSDRTKNSAHYLQLELETLLQSDVAMWHFLQQGSLDGIWYWDLERPDQEWMSPEMWRLFGIDPATKSHSPSEWQDIIFQEDLAVAIDNFNKHCADPNHPYDQVVRYRHANGSTVWVRCRGIAIRDEHGTAIRMLGAHNDLTAIKQAEEQAQIDKRKAQAANSELKSFAYSVSHDMKSPANTLQLILDELHLHLRDRGDSDGLELAEFALQSVNRMRNLVEDVLDYTRVVGQSLKFEFVDLNAIAREALDNLDSDLKTTGGRVEIGKLPTVQANAVQMKLLFQNLIANGLKFHRPGVAPKITISGARDSRSERWAITCRDNGIGIDPAYHERIFTMFERLHQKEEYDGTGLGLPLCRRIAVNHGGSISIVPQTDQGTTFRIEMPDMQR